MTPIIHDLDQDIKFAEELRILSKHEPEPETDEEFSADWINPDRMIDFKIIGLCEY